MNDPFQLPRGAKHYLLLQRPRYQTGRIKDIFQKVNLRRKIYDRYLLPYFDANSTSLFTGVGG
jgi:hypothetical protein